MRRVRDSRKYHTGIQGPRRPSFSKSHHFPEIILTFGSSVGSISIRASRDGSGDVFGRSFSHWPNNLLPSYLAGYCEPNTTAPSSCSDPGFWPSWTTRWSSFAPYVLFRDFQGFTSKYDRVGRQEQSSNILL